jgi:MSHA pilin protein MshA
MNSKGFTLIELVVVIVILGILAITAVPKYINLKADAQTATLEGVKAAMQGASSLVYGKSLVAGNQKLSSASIILSDGTELDIQHGYPKASKDDWYDLLDIDEGDFKITELDSSILGVYPATDDAPFNVTDPCILVYIQASPSSKPVYVVNKCQ